MNLKRVKRFFDSHINSIRINDCICPLCKWVYKDGETCKAFPDGIPAEILFGEITHFEFLEGDNDFRFEPIIEA